MLAPTGCPAALVRDSVQPRHPQPFYVGESYNLTNKVS